MPFYTVKQLAGMIEPGQLGIQGDEDMLLFRPTDPYDPRLKSLADISGWKFVKGFDNVLQAYPTLENYYFLELFSFKFNASLKVMKWFARATNVLSGEELIDWTKHSTLFDFQKDGARFLTLHRRAMLSLSPGLGKTLTSAYAAGLRGFKSVLVVCPASLLFYWKGELEKWADKLPVKPYPTIFHRGKVYSSDEDMSDGSQLWLITNPETIVKYGEEIVKNNLPYDCLIVDESIMYKHRESGRSQAMKELAKHIETVWFLTGAPATRFLDDMWHQFHILKPQGYPSYWRFARKYCVIADDEWGSKVVSNAPFAEKEIKKNFADIYFSRTQDDVANIPDWIMEDLDIPMPPAQNKAYDTLRKELYVRLESIDPTQVITVSNHLSLMIRSVQVASNPVLLGGVNAAGKWDALPELMKIYPGPYIVWVNFIETGNLIKAMLNSHKYRVALANGSTPMEDRNKMVDAFQRGEIDALILNNQVGKFGFTLTKARTAFFVERMYDDSFYQCLHRNRRIGTTHSPVVVKLLSVTQDGKPTIDHLINSVLDYRTGMIRKVTAGELKKVFEE